MDIYELLNKIIVNESFKLSPDLFTQADRDLLDESARPLFDLLKNISSLGTKIHNLGITFHPMFVMADGQKAFAVEDITDDDYEMLKAIDFERLPLVLKSRVADILWIQKKDFAAAQIAAEAYWELCQLWYANGDNLGTLKMVQRAVCISVQTNQTSLYSRICTWFEAFLIHGATRGDCFISLRIIELFAEQKNSNVSSFLPVLDDMISSNSDNVLMVEQVYKLKTYCLNKLKDKEGATNNNLSLAQYYVDFAEKIVKDNIHNAMRAASFFQKAVILYRNNGAPGQAEKTHKRLVEIQKEIPKNMVPISTKLDIKDILDNIKVNMEGLTFEESIIRLTQIIVFDHRESIKSRVIKELKEFPPAHLFGKNLINAHGQTILPLPPLDIRNPEKDPKLLELHIYQNALKKQQMAGDIWVKNTLSFIKDKFTVENSMIDFLIKGNPIIPEGRERIFQKAICMFLRGEFYEAIHILAPQTENLFRNIAAKVGGLTVTLENDGSSMEKVLSSIFSLPEMLDSYDNDILFTFRGLLNEKAGANIRNEVAHGIIEEAACSSGVCLYFGAAVIKLLTYTSTEKQNLLKFIREDKHFCRHHDGIYILFHTALLISEFCGLTLKDVEFEEMRIKVNRRSLIKNGPIFLK